MLLTNFKHMMALILERTSVNKGLLPVRRYDGTTYYLCANSLPWLSSPAYGLALSESATGICLGTGNTAATVDDYKLQTQITQGIQAAITQTLELASGDPVLTFDIAVTNTSASDITVREIGYRQTLYASTLLNGGGGNQSFLLDRTVLAVPITIEAGNVGVIRYSLKTLMP